MSVVVNAVFILTDAVGEVHRARKHNANNAVFRGLLMSPCLRPHRVLYACCALIRVHAPPHPSTTKGRQGGGVGQSKSESGEAAIDDDDVMMTMTATTMRPPTMLVMPMATAARRRPEKVVILPSSPLHARVAHAQIRGLTSCSFPLHPLGHLLSLSSSAHRCSCAHDRRLVTVAVTILMTGKGERQGGRRGGRGSASKAITVRTVLVVLTVVMISSATSAVVVHTVRLAVTVKVMMMVNDPTMAIGGLVAEVASGGGGEMADAAARRAEGVVGRWRPVTARTVMVGGGPSAPGWSVVLQAQQRDNLKSPVPNEAGHGTNELHCDEIPTARRDVMRAPRQRAPEPRDTPTRKYGPDQEGDTTRRFNGVTTEPVK